MGMEDLGGGYINEKGEFIRGKDAPKQEENNVEILKENLATLLDLFRVDVESVKYDYDENLKLKAGQLLAIADSQMPGGTIIDPYEYLLRIRVARNETKKGIEDLNKPEETKQELLNMSERLDMPGLEFPEEWKSKRLANENLENFKEVLLQ